MNAPFTGRGLHTQLYGHRTFYHMTVAASNFQEQKVIEIVIQSKVNKLLYRQAPGLAVDALLIGTN